MPSAASQQRAIEAALRSQPGTLHYVAEADQQVSVAGLPGQVPVTAFRGDARWTGYDMISGRWFTGPGQLDVPTNFLTVTAKAIGDTVTITFGSRQIRARIVSEVFDTSNHGISMLTDWQTLAAPGQRLTLAYDVALRPGTNATEYASALSAALGPDGQVSVNSNDPFFFTLTGLIAILTLLLSVVAGLGVLNTVVLQSRERVHDLGIFKAVGMTPRQTIAMVICCAPSSSESSGTGARAPRADTRTNLGAGGLRLPARRRYLERDARRLGDDDSPDEAREPGPAHRQSDAAPRCCDQCLAGGTAEHRADLAGGAVDEPGGGRTNDRDGSERR